MLPEQTIDDLHALSMHAMAESVRRGRGDPAREGLAYEERLGLDVGAERTSRAQKQLDRRVRQAKLKTNAAPEGIDYRPGRGLDRAVMANLLAGAWLGSMHVLLTGATGTGKTNTGCAIAFALMRAGHRTRYAKVSTLLEEYEIARHDGSLPRLRASLARIELHLLDDWGLAPLTPRQAQDLFEVVDLLSGRSFVIMSQLPVDQWHAYIGAPMVADAICDRLVHNAIPIELKGESMRKLNANATTNA